MKFLDYTGLSTFWNAISELLSGKVDKVSGKGLSTEDYTTAEKTKLGGIDTNANNYTLPTAAAGTKGGVQVGAGLQMTGDTMSVPTMTGATNSAAGAAGLAPAPAAGDEGKFLTGAGTYAVPHDTTYSAATGSAAGLMSAADKSKLDGFSSASSYALKTDITNVYRYKGSVASRGYLPDPEDGDPEPEVGDVYNISSTGMNVAWDGEDWDDLGQAFDVTSITDAEIQDMMS